MPQDDRLHIRPRRGWLNDPNGIGFWDGRWHVMYQWNPGDTTHRNIHWGHASSGDLIDWRDEGAALSPRPGTIDDGGVWSGVAVVDDDVPTLVYTAIRGDARDSGVAVARGRLDGGGGRTFVQGDSWVAPHPEGWIDVRDPFLVSIEGRRYAVQGAGRPTGGGAVLIYAVPELAAPWQLLGELTAAADLDPSVLAAGDVWECPQLVRLGGTWVLIVSWYEDGGARQGVTAYAGEVEVIDGVPRFAAREGAPLDLGPDFYAPQVVEDGDRVLVWAWSWESRAVGAHGISLRDVADRGWAGMLTAPRELELDEAGRPLLALCREIRDLTGRALTPVRLEHGYRLETAAATTWRAETRGPVELRLHSPGGGARTVWSSRTPHAATVLVGETVVETFEHHGSRTVRVYPRPEETWVLESLDDRASVRAAVLG